MTVLDVVGGLGVETQVGSLEDFGRLDLAQGKRLRVIRQRVRYEGGCTTLASSREWIVRGTE